MNRFYKYLKSFDRFILKHSKLLGLIFSICALISFVYALVKVDYSGFKLEFNHSLASWLGLIGFFFLNQFLDGFIWSKILKEFTIRISILLAIKMNWKSHFYAIVTPNRIGEIPARRMLLEKENDIETYKSASLHYITKPIAFVLILTISSLILFLNFEFSYIFCVLSVVSLLLYIFAVRIRFYLDIIGLNVLRVSVYCLQHIFILKLLNFDLIDFTNITFIHSSGALIPHVFGFELFVKSIIFDTVSNQSNGIILFSFSLFVLWLMNIVLPSLVSLTFKLKSE